MPALRQMDAKSRARSGSCEEPSSRRRRAAGPYRLARAVAGRIKDAFDAASDRSRSRRRRYLALPVHDDPRTSRLLEAALLKIGLALMIVYLLVRFDASASGDRDLSSLVARDPDTSLWSPGRIAGFRASTSAPEALVGALFIRSLDLAAPIYADTSEVHLNRGVGLIAATAKLGALGNIGLAGHRDGYFRALKDIESGDTIELVTQARSYMYRVLRVSIVERDDASALRHTDTPTVTLVTCYPFYFVGPAPQRFVVQGELVSSQPRAASVSNR